MKVKALNVKIHGDKLILPLDGLVSIPVDGIVEVSAECGKILLGNTSDWAMEEAQKKTEKDEEAEELKAITEGIKAMTIEQLEEAATEAGYPEKEWKKYTGEKPQVKLFAGYLIGKLKKK